MITSLEVSNCASSYVKESSLLETEKGKVINDIIEFKTNSLDSFEARTPDNKNIDLSNFIRYTTNCYYKISSSMIDVFKNYDYVLIDVVSRSKWGSLETGFYYSQSIKVSF